MVGWRFPFLFQRRPVLRLVECAVVTHHRGLTDDDAAAVIDEDPMSQDRTRMDLDQSEKSGDLGDQDGRGTAYCGSRTSERSDARSGHGLPGIKAGPPAHFSPPDLSPEPPLHQARYLSTTFFPLLCHPVVIF